MQTDSEPLNRWRSGPDTAFDQPELAAQIAQMIVVRASGHLFDQQIEYPVWEPPAAILRHWLQDLGIGGVILLGGTAAEVGLRTQLLQSWATQPLLICADIEEGVGQRFAGATWFPPPMAIGEIAQRDLNQAVALAEAMGAATAQEALAIGINWLLAPVVDVNNNSNNPVINIRAWAEAPEIVGQLTAAFIRGAQRYPVLTAAKHFPGHGDTSLDSHLELPLLQHDRTRLAAVELPPFQQAIATGVDAVMTAHLLLPKFDPDLPVTLSPSILTGLLRQDLDFPGLIVTDALVMGAIANRYGKNEAAVLAVAAGADVLMMPADPVGAIAAIYAAVQSGRIDPAQIQASVDRIRRAKQKVASSWSEPTATTHAWEQREIAPIQLEPIAQPQTLTTVETILQASLRLYCPYPLRTEQSPTGPNRNLILLDDALNCAFLNRQAAAIQLPQSWGYRLQVIDSHTPAIDRTAEAGAATLFQVFIRGNPFRSSATLIQQAQSWLTWLLETEQLQALIVYGSPYAAETLIAQLPDTLPYAFSYAQIPVAQRVALTALFPNPVHPSSGSGEFTD